jgi:hypothetical protein
VITSKALLNSVVPFDANLWSSDGFAYETGDGVLSEKTIAGLAQRLSEQPNSSAHIQADESIDCVLE